MTVMTNFIVDKTDGRHVMLPNGELHVLAVRQGDENHLYHCRVLVRPNGQTMTSTTAGRMLLLSGRKIFLSSTNKNEFLLYQLIFKNLIALKDTMTKTAPVIVESVNRVRVWRGQDAVLPCVFQGYPPPKIKSVSIFLFFFCRPFSLSTCFVMFVNNLSRQLANFVQPPKRPNELPTCFIQQSSRHLSPPG